MEKNTSCKTDNLAFDYSYAQLTRPCAQQCLTSAVLAPGLRDLTRTSVSNNFFFWLRQRFRAAYATLRLPCFSHHTYARSLRRAFAELTPSLRH